MDEINASLNFKLDPLIFEPYLQSYKSPFGVKLKLSDFSYFEVDDNGNICPEDYIDTDEKELFYRATDRELIRELIENIDVDSDEINEDEDDIESNDDDVNDDDDVSENNINSKTEAEIINEDEDDVIEEVNDTDIENHNNNVEENIDNSDDSEEDEDIDGSEEDEDSDNYSEDYYDDDDQSVYNEYIATDMAIQFNHNTEFIEIPYEDITPNLTVNNVILTDIPNNDHQHLYYSIIQNNKYCYKFNRKFSTSDCEANTIYKNREYKKKY